MSVRRLSRLSPPNGFLKIASYGLGVFLTMAVAGATVMEGGERLHAKSMANVGHDSLACVDCHLPAKGTSRQQLQAKVAHWLGWRSNDATFGYEPVTNGQCMGCHERAEDAHPVHRFLEPRFVEARATLGASECSSCHTEHTGRRVTAPPAMCSTCHGDIELKQDPIDISHRMLAAGGQWSTCLGCHDYHGNHLRDPQKRLDDAISIGAIERYFDGEPSPYGNERRFKAKGGPQ